MSRKKKFAPLGYKAYKDEYHFYYPNQEGKHQFYKSQIQYNPNNKILYIQLSGYTTDLIEERKIKYSITKNLKSYLGFNKYISDAKCEINNRTNKCCVIYQLHSLLEYCPSIEENKKIKEIFEENLIKFDT